MLMRAPFVLIRPDAAYCSSAVSYTGPGDIFTFSAWWGLRAYSAATVGNNAIRLVRASDSTQQNFTTIAGGGLDLTSIGTFMAATTAKVVTLFDQTGGGNDVTQVTDANRPNFLLTILGSFPAVEFVKATPTRLVNSSSPGTFAQPNSYSMVAFRKSASSGSNCAVFGTANGSATILYSNGGNLRVQFNSVASSFALSSDAWHAFGALSNGASGKTYLDGSVGTGVNAGTTSQSGVVQIGDDTNSNFPHDGYIMEAGFSAGDQSASFVTISNNQHAFYGF